MCRLTRPIYISGDPTNIIGSVGGGGSDIRYIIEWNSLHANNQWVEICPFYYSNGQWISGTGSRNVHVIYI